MANNGKGYGISPQISKYQTGKKLLEFTNKLALADKGHYAHIHSQDGAKSCIGITLLDYSKGTGANTVSVSANLSPAQVEWWYTAVQARLQLFELKQEKIHSYKADAQGVAPVTKMVINRNPMGHDGQPSRYPWYVSVENGTGRVQRNQNGGTSIAPQSYQKTSQVFVNLTDEDMFRVLYSVHGFISMWEVAFAPALVSAGVDAARAQMQQGYNQQPQQPQYSQQGMPNQYAAQAGYPQQGNQPQYQQQYQGWGPTPNIPTGAPGPQFQ